MANPSSEARDIFKELEQETQNELNQIMGDLDSASDPEVDNRLQSGMDEEEALAEFRAGRGDASLEETLGDITQSEVEAQSPIFQAISGGRQKTMNDHNASVSLVLSGEMTLKLKYEFDGQEVTVGFEDQMLVVKMSDGTEFRIPVRRNVVDSAA